MIPTPTIKLPPDLSFVSALDQIFTENRCKTSSLSFSDLCNSIAVVQGHSSASQISLQDGYPERSDFLKGSFQVSLDHLQRCFLTDVSIATRTIKSFRTSLLNVKKHLGTFTE